MPDKITPDQAATVLADLDALLSLPDEVRDRVVALLASPHPCTVCGAPLPANSSPRRKYCDPCRRKVDAATQRRKRITLPETMRGYDRTRNQRRTAARLAARTINPLRCVDCDAALPPDTDSRTRYCRPCHKLRRHTPAPRRKLACVTCQAELPDDAHRSRKYCATCYGARRTAMNAANTARYRHAAMAVAASS